MEYKGFEIVRQYVRHEIWRVDQEGVATDYISDYRDEFRGWLVWDTENEWQHEDFDATYNSLDEVKQAIDEHLSKLITK